MFNIPFFDVLKSGKNILIAGAGGGYDVFTGLPLFFALQGQGKSVHLANLSFSFLPRLDDLPRLSPDMLTITADTPILRGYAPESFLARWFRQELDLEIPIHCFERTGVKPLLKSYTALVKHLNIDTIILVDGGTDSLMRGDEDGLGTPTEDMVSIAAVHQIDLPRKSLLCLGFGVDRFHGVSNWFSLESIAELTRDRGFLGSFSLLQDMPSVQKYQAATQFVFAQMPDSISIVSSSILSALAGHYGDYHATPRTLNSKLWINPLMAILWSFNLEHIAQRVQYLEALKETSGYWEAQQMINSFRRSQSTTRQREPLPD